MLNFFTNNQLAIIVYILIALVVTLTISIICLVMTKRRLKEEKAELQEKIRKFKIEEKQTLFNLDELKKECIVAVLEVLGIEV